MNFASFIRQANRLGRQKTAFFFLIDFERQKPLISPLESAVENGIIFSVEGNTNFYRPVELPRQKIRFSSEPVSFERYAAGFALVQQELQKGNSYLLNLTYPSKINTNYNLAQIFQATKAPYKLLLQDQFVCFSPESFIRIRQNQIFTYPMKGTIDAALPQAEQQLMQSEKEGREHYTIVDLMRNDLAMVAENIRVRRFRYIDKISTNRGEILQTSSEITGNLTADWQNRIGSILAALLPAGSISGAPKEKTVSIIRQAEGGKRGYYSGIFGIFNGEELNSAVAIRYIEQKDGQLYFRSGGGITSQSRLQEEYEEYCQKVYLPIHCVE
ncbi:aminodeoxychorismate synthase component I [[Mannheimia] succiniciproducens]|uniref:TrpE protein n=1 Tax=Mannheimia succiniciproducens (strain KCTC 0769BP / MBEL55E) TaxID=221988 RepID=Q65QG0_MANSM|nr:aminodeoxychorismate synthase component I [[Mannheimia] succiniciproducens]AAU38800.1 TrpE protein [[Mannheimia] succiniciproducens MBEL55E]